MVWFVAASLVSLLLGMVFVNVLRPGDNLNLPLPDAQASTNLKVMSLSMKEFVAHLVPRSIVEAMATNEILQIVVFSLFFGVACAAVGERASKLVEGIEELSHVILSITGYIMALAPIAVFASMSAIVTTQGLGILVTYGKFVLEFYFGLVVLWCLLIAVGFVILGPHSFRLINLGARALPARVLHREQRGGLSQDDGAARKISDQQEDHQLRPPHGVFVQPRRLDDVLYVCHAVHCAGL
jgi:Na+/H+-dicarboxylate symporter